MKRGFTIVELLIVIVVIAILATITIVAYNGIQQRTRDNIRKADLATIENALELFYIDKGVYHEGGELCLDTSIGSDGACTGTITNIGDWAAASDLRELVTAGYIIRIPKDPINNATYKYTFEPWNSGQGSYTKDAQAYDLCATLEAGGSYCINKRK